MLGALEKRGHKSRGPGEISDLHLCCGVRPECQPAGLLAVTQAAAAAEKQPRSGGPAACGSGMRVSGAAGSGQLRVSLGLCVHRSSHCCPGRILLNTSPGWEFKWNCILLGKMKHRHSFRYFVSSDFMFHGITWSVVVNHVWRD